MYRISFLCAAVLCATNLLAQQPSISPELVQQPVYNSQQPRQATPIFGWQQQLTPVQIGQMVPATQFVQPVITQATPRNYATPVRDLLFGRYSYSQVPVGAPIAVPTYQPVFNAAPVAPQPFLQVNGPLLR